MTEAFEELAAAYYRGMHEGDAALLRSLFDPEARIQGSFEGRWIASGLEPFLAAVTARPTPADLGEAPDLELVSLRVDGDVAAAVVRDVLHGRTFLDHLHLARSDAGWRIVAKTFTTLAAGVAAEKGDPK